MVGVFVEEAAEVVSDEARGVECGLLEEGFLDGGRSQGNGVALLAKERVLVGEVSNAVLLAQRPHAEHEDAGHEEELEEALLPLRHVGHQTERLTSRRRGSAVGDAIGGTGIALPAASVSRWNRTRNRPPPRV